MNLRNLRLFVLLALLCIASVASGKELVRKFTGSGNKATAEFEVTAPWILDWRVTGEFQAAMGLQVDLVDAKSGQFVGKVASTKWVSDGVRLFNESGLFRFEVRSNFADWTLIVEQLSKEEAKAYTPKHPQ